MLCAIFMFALSSLPGCVKVDDSIDRVEMGDTLKDVIYSDELLYLSYTMLMVTQVDGYYHAFGLGKDGKVDKSVEYTQSGRYRNVQGMKLAKIPDPEKYLGWPFEELKARLGEPHGDTESGFFWPGYFTEDAKLVYFDVPDFTIESVTVVDILTKKAKRFDVE